MTNILLNFLANSLTNFLMNSLTNYFTNWCPDTDILTPNAKFRGFLLEYLPLGICNTVVQCTREYMVVCQVGHTIYGNMAPLNHHNNTSRHKQSHTRLYTPNTRQIDLQKAMVSSTKDKVYNYIRVNWKDHRDCEWINNKKSSQRSFGPKAISYKIATFWDDHNHLVSP